MICDNALYDIGIGLITGIVSGFITGYIVYFATKRRERKYEAYYYWSKFLFSALEKCEMYIPIENLNYRFMIDKKKDSRWQSSTQKIIDYINPFGHEDREFSDEENDFFNNIIIALEELENWRKKNHLH